VAAILLAPVLEGEDDFLFGVQEEGGVYKEGVFFGDRDLGDKRVVGIAVIDIVDAHGGVCFRGFVDKC